MASRWKTAAQNGSLAVLSIAILYLVVEVVFFRMLLPHVSRNVRPHLPDRADFFLQNSKAQHVPRDYIALVGDSYAQGVGDWLLTVGGDGSQPYHSGDILHESLGRDVVTLGRVGAGSAEAMVRSVTRVYDDDYCYLFPGIEKPKQLLIYFYEGNDIDDNHVLLHLKVKPDGSELRAQVDRFFQQQYARPSAWRCHGHLGDTIFRMLRFVVWYRFNPNVAAQLLDLPRVNRVLVAGAPVDAPALVVPSLTLNDEAIDAGVVVFERALAWLRQRFADVPMTLVYVPSPAAIYRHAVNELTSTDPFDSREIEHYRGGRYSAAAVYASSQKICEKIRAVTLAQGAAFIDTRAAFRLEASKRAVHGPRDWDHLNEAGHRLLGTLLARRIAERPNDTCDDQWP